jgi:hypothetical protein
MITVLRLLLALGLLGAFDTIYYHEWRARLPAKGRSAGLELKLHAVRDFLYAPLFATLPFFKWQGWCALVLSLLLVSEILITIWDFVIEDWVRKPMGGLFPGERITHAVMGIVYGAMLAYLVPTMRLWSAQSTTFTRQGFVPRPLSVLLLVLGVGVFLSGCRDLASALELPLSAWPWTASGGSQDKAH